MAPRQNIASRVSSSARPARAASKRKRAANVDDEGIDSEKENVESNNDERPKKKLSKNLAKAMAKPQVTSNANEAKRLYAETLKAIDKDTSSIDKKVKAMDPNSKSITTATYASSAAKHLPSVTKLVSLDSIRAFNLLLALADASHADINATLRMCGEPGDQSKPVFRKLDNALLPLVEERAKPTGHATNLPSVPHRWTREDVDVGEFKTGRPNKQQRNQMYAQELEWEKGRREARRQRREDVDDWVTVALSDLKEERDYLDLYGVEEYLPQSIARLEALVAGRET